MWLLTPKCIISNYKYLLRKLRQQSSEETHSHHCQSSQHSQQYPHLPPSIITKEQTEQCYIKLWYFRQFVLAFSEYNALHGGSKTLDLWRHKGSINTTVPHERNMRIRYTKNYKSFFYRPMNFVFLTQHFSCLSHPTRKANIQFNKLVSLMQYSSLRL